MKLYYLGGKSRIAKQIAAVMLAATDDRSTYIEPFVGAGSVAVQMVPHFEHAYLSDASPDLIMLWKALQLGWEPPEFVSEEYYQALRNAAPSAVRGFVGYGCSFGGKWFGGYARNNPTNDYARASRNSIIRKTNTLRATNFYCLGYGDILIPNGSVVYLDPPYANTTAFGGVAHFDSANFWKWAESISVRASVFVSEYSAPEGWQPVWSGRPQSSLGTKDKTGRAAEYLWTYDPAQSVALVEKVAA
jgi:DNA adenine methylase